MKRMRTLYPYFFSLLLSFVLHNFPVCASADARISDISVSPQFFNPTIGEKVNLKFTISQSGILTVEILDRDGFVVRSLLTQEFTEAGIRSLVWPGTNDQNQTVPDENYSIKITLESKGKTDTYFPANKIPENLRVKIDYYDRKQGIISYKLPQAGRVHLQAGCARLNPKTKKMAGPIMKTIVNREPRAAGAIAETWNGYDESGTIYIPELPNFVTAVAATSLPENSITVTGERSRTFIESIADRKGNSLFTFSASDHQHHQGLSSLEDISPAMSLTLSDAEYSELKKIWIVHGKTVLLKGSIVGPSALHFLKQPGMLFFFVDGRTFKEIQNPKQPFTQIIPTDKLSPGVHIVSVNWGSLYGPTSANSVRIEVDNTGGTTIVQD